MGAFYQHIEDVLKIYNENYDYIFQIIFENGTYNLLGVVLLLVPLMLLSLFYFFWKYPYGKFWHWIIYVAIIALIAGAISWQVMYSGIFNTDSDDLNNLLNNNTEGYADFAYSLLPKYALINGVLSTVVSFVYSLVLKQFSKIQIHLPF